MSGQEPDPAPARGPAAMLQNTPNAERYVLEADAMRRRQLRAALLHGSSRTWRDNPRVWPAVAIGLVVAALIIAGLVVTRALQVSERNQNRQEQQQEQQQKQQQQQQRLQKEQEQQQRLRSPAPGRRPSGPASPASPAS